MSLIIPKHNASTLLHHKSNDGEECSLYPITMYNKVINAPHYTDSINTCYGAEFVLFQNRVEEVMDKTYDRMMGTADFNY